MSTQKTIADVLQFGFNRVPPRLYVFSAGAVTIGLFMIAAAMVGVEGFSAYGWIPGPALCTVPE